MRPPERPALAAAGDAPGATDALGGGPACGDAHAASSAGAPSAAKLVTLARLRSARRVNLPLATFVPSCLAALLAERSSSVIDVSPPPFFDTALIAVAL